MVDPWNILGFGGQFSLFAAVENSIPDPRVDELLDLMWQVFALYGRLWQEAAMAGAEPLEKRAVAGFRKRASWWDQFATTSVGGIEHVSGAESLEAAERVAVALATWHQAGQESGKINFWRPHVEQFESPQAYGRVISTLLDRADLQAAMAR